MFILVIAHNNCQTNDMFLELQFPFAPLSQNNIERTGFKTNLRYKTAEAKEYRQNMEAILQANKKRIASFIDTFCSDTDGVVIEFYWYINHELCLTKKKPRRLSKRGGDYDNYIKYTQDVFFDYMQTNDFYIHTASQYKRPTQKDSHFIIRLKVEKLSDNEFFKPFLS